MFKNLDLVTIFSKLVEEVFRLFLKVKIKQENIKNSLKNWEILKKMRAAPDQPGLIAPRRMSLPIRFGVEVDSHGRQSSEST